MYEAGNEEIQIHNSNKKNKEGGRHKHMYSGVPTGEYDDGRYEKPWQRVPSPFIILVLGFYILFAFVAQMVEDDMPTVVLDSEISNDDYKTFSEEAAWGYLRTIVGDQPRVSGAEYHYNKTIDLKNLLDSIAAQAFIPVHTDWQFVTDDYWLTSYTAPFVNSYQNLSNIVALLEGESGFYSNGSIGTSVLLNCHYDSVPFTVGASDNGVFCAVMAETLHRMSRRRDRFKHNIVFLFNGAEENGLQASHGFLKHPWSENIIAVVNLDAAGMNGKPNLFQVTDPRVLEAYRNTAPRPNAQSFGEFLFGSGLIPSDTDFRIWRDFGNISGIDMAFSKWGHVYHTRFDNLDLIQPGVIQCAGDMFIGLVEEMADDEALAEEISPSAAVYYDYLNVFLVTYSLSGAYAVDAAVLLVAAVSILYYVWLVGFRSSTFRELGYTVLGRVASMISGFILALILTPIAVATTVQMRYMTQPWIVVASYWLPYLVTAVTVAHVYDAWRSKKNGLNRTIRTLQAMAATRTLLALILFMLIFVTSLATLRYVLAVPLLIMSITSIISLTVVRYFNLRAWQHLILELLLSVPGALFVFSMALRIDALMLPIMGRTPMNTPDYLVAALNVGLAALIACIASGIELLFSRKRLWIFSALLMSACVVITFIPFSPYSDDGPSTQRHYWFHSEIVSYDINRQPIERTSGIVVTRFDAYTTERVLPALAQRNYHLNSRRDFDDDCDKYVYCNLPLFRARFGQYLRDALFLYTGPPAPFDPPPSFDLLSKECVGETCTLHFLVNGPAHHLITLHPHIHVNLTFWSFVSPPTASHTQLERPVYVAVHTVSTYSAVLQPLQFNVTLVVPLSMQSQAIIDVSHHSHKIQHPEDFTDEYNRILDAMPKYFNIATFLSYRHNYVF